MCEQIKSLNLFFAVPLAGLQLVSLINNISNIVSPSPLLTQLSDIPTSLLCDQCPEEYCECLHVLKVPLNSVVEMIIADTCKFWDKLSTNWTFIVLL